MQNKLLNKIKPNDFEILKRHVICAISGKKIAIENINYWSVGIKTVFSTI